MLKPDQIQGADGRVISFGDTVIIERKTGDMTTEEVSMFIPECCREGWDSCTHVPKKQRRIKTNKGL